MKKYFAILMMTVMLAVSVPMFAGSAYAQTYDCSYYGDCSNGTNVYDRHRKAINIGAGILLGALIGGKVGGKKGAIIGAGAGAVGGIVITKKQRPRNTETYYPYNY